MTSYFFPGQGSQHKGMGEKLFAMFPEVVEQANDILGYSILELCLEDPHGQLNQTAYTQPALFTINAMHYQQQCMNEQLNVRFLAGHSLGEYNALHAAGAISFEQGLKIVQKRGELMAAMPEGGMAAVIGKPINEVESLLTQHGVDSIDIANINSFDQIVISGPRPAIEDCADLFNNANALCIPLKVSGAFHSRYMQAVKSQFSEFLQGFEFNACTIPVIANVTALPYQNDQIPHLLTEQIVNPVNWFASIKYMLDQGETNFTELGPGNVLTKLLVKIKSQYKPAPTNPVQNQSSAASISMDDVNQASANPNDTNCSQTFNKTEARTQVERWNNNYQVGTLVMLKNSKVLVSTRTHAEVIFDGHLPVIYVDGFKGYIPLTDVRVAKE